MRFFARMAWLSCAAWCSLATAATGQLLVAAAADAPAPLDHAELAYARGTGEPVTWLSLRIGKEPVAIVAALSASARAEPALGAWFEALEAVGAPRVTLPSDVSCSGSEMFERVRWSRSEGAPPMELWLEQSEDVSAALDQLGLALPAPLPSAERYLLWSWPAGEGDRSTRTLRIEGGDDVLPLLPAPGVPILLSAVTAGSASFADERVDAELAVTFEAGTPARSDYRQRLDAWFDRHREPLIELRSKTALWNWSVYGAGVSIPPLTVAYAAAAAREEQGIDAEACGQQLRSLDGPDAAPPSACGPARDVELALSAAGTARATLERFVIAGRVGVTPGFLVPGGDIRAPILRAKSASGESCTSAAAPVNGGPVPVVTGPSTGESDGVVVEQTPITAPPAEASCGSSTQSESGESDSCSSDSSGSQSSDSDSCSGDSSSSSSQTSDDGGCGSNSSSNSDTDDGCDGGSDKNGYDGDTCSGNAAPGGERTEKSRQGLAAGSRSRPKRLKTSLWTLSFAAVMLPIRRRKRAVRSGC